MTLEEAVDALELPMPLVDAQGNGEPLEQWARRVALIGAYVGKAHTLTHTQPVIIQVPVPVADPAPVIPGPEG